MLKGKKREEGDSCNSGETSHLKRKKISADCRIEGQVFAAKATA